MGQLGLGRNGLKENIIVLNTSISVPILIRQIDGKSDHLSFLTTNGDVWASGTNAVLFSSSLCSMVLLELAIVSLVDLLR